METLDQDRCGTMTIYNTKTEPAAFGSCRPEAALSRQIELARRTSFSRVLYLVSSLMRKAALRVIGTGSVDYDFRGMNVRFRPNGNTAEKRALLNPSRFDQTELAFIESRLPLGGVFLDIGANVGLYSLVAAKTAGLTGRILAFEANPPVMERLAFNIASNPPDETGLAPVELIGKALTGENGPVTFAPPAGNLGEGRVLNDGEQQEGSFTVEGIRLEDCLMEYGVEQTDMMKIDIEGHELHALEPFLTKAPASLHPTFMIVERGSEDHWQPLAALFCAAGYEPYTSCHMNEIWRKTK